MIQTLITLGSPFRGTLAADVGADPRKLATLSPANMLAAIASFVGATALRFPFTAAADTHFAILELRHAVSRLAEGDFGPLASYFSGIFSLNDAALQELTTENCSRIFPVDCSDLAGVESFSFAGKLPPAGSDRCGWRCQSSAAGVVPLRAAQGDLRPVGRRRPWGLRPGSIRQR